ncbi:MAG: hypothetical protein AAGM36_09260 [Cyanobacteria bacterium J06597_1]
MTWKVCCAAFLCGSLVAAIAVWSTANACFVPQDGDSRFFGNTLAASDGYFAVGDSTANRVTLFRRNPGGRWSRWQTITPPVGSDAARAGSGFGSAIALDGTTLAIGAQVTSILSQPDIPSPETLDRPETPNQYRANRTELASAGDAYTGSVFATSILEDSLAPLQEISIPDRNIVGHAVSVSGDRVAIRSSFTDGLGRQRRRVLIADLNTRETTDIIEAPTLQAGSSFGTSVDLNDFTLVIGAPYDPPEGAAWIYPLEGELEPYRLPGKAGSLAFAGGSVALGDGFFAISSATSWGRSYTSIVSGDRVPILLNMGGRLSSNGRSLSIARVSFANGERAGLVRVYDILRHGAPRLVKEIPDGEQAALGTNFVAVLKVIRTRSQDVRREVCIVPL